MGASSLLESPSGAKQASGPKTGPFDAAIAIGVLIKGGLYVVEFPR
jgi:6,7-dimethyl-8-ribityllumazine synthase